MTKTTLILILMNGCVIIWNECTIIFVTDWVYMQKSLIFKFIKCLRSTPCFSARPVQETNKICYLCGATTCLQQLKILIIFLMRWLKKWIERTNKSFWFSHIQWNLSIPDTLGTNKNVLITGVNLYYKP